MDMRQETAHLLTGGLIKDVHPSEVAEGSVIAVRPGERVPLDGVVTSGRTAIDTSALTGEPVPKDIAPGDGVLSGCVNTTGLIEIKTTKTLADSAVSVILKLTEDAAGKKAKTERFITRFAKVYTPAVVAAAAALAVVPAFFGFGFQVRRALVFLVASCPCALVISIPLGFLAGIGRLGKMGVLVKGGAYIEALAEVESVAFDKTGTLTSGEFGVTAVSPLPGFTEEALLTLAAAAESGSNHPIARSVTAACGKPAPTVSEYSELPGLGARAVLNGKTVLAGSRALIEEYGMNPPLSDCAAVFVAVDGKPAGFIALKDRIKPEAAGAVAELRALGVRNITMLTGDSSPAAAETAELLKLDGLKAGLMPTGKLAALQEIKGRKAFVGDGVNDAPALALADVGVAIGGGLGADAAYQAADVTILSGDVSKLPLAIRSARSTRRVVRQNVIFSLAVKGLVLALGALGAAPIWAAVYADVGVAFIAVVNSARAGRA
jgi:Cd2+/Zn2+-exporting ATPase